MILTYHKIPPLQPPHDHDLARYIASHHNSASGFAFSPTIPKSSVFCSTCFLLFYYLQLMFVRLVAMVTMKIQLY